MSKLLSASLAITVGSNTVTPMVKYQAFFEEGDRNLMKIFPKLFRVRCELWGADSGLNGADDLLFTYPETHFYSDGSITSVESKTFQRTLTKGAELDEDWNSLDDVYAKVILISALTNTAVSIRKSNQVSGSF